MAQTRSNLLSRRHLLGGALLLALPAAAIARRRPDVTGHWLVTLHDDGTTERLEMFITEVNRRTGRLTINASFNGSEVEVRGEVTKKGKITLRFTVDGEKYRIKLNLDEDGEGATGTFKSGEEGRSGEASANKLS